MTTPATGVGNVATNEGRPRVRPGRVLPATLMSDTATQVGLPGKVTTQQLAAMYRQRQMAIGLAASRAVAAVWQQNVDPADMNASWGALRDIVLQLIRSYFQAASADSAQTFEQLRVLSDLPFRQARIATLPAQELERVTDSQSIGRFFQLAPDMPTEMAGEHAGQALEAASARLALKGGRQTMVEAVHSDPLATGWERTISGTACSFCSMLASRGAVYKSEKSADFRAHDHCNCTALPVFRGQEASPQSLDLARQWREVTARKSGAAARRAWQDHWEKTNGGRISGATSETEGAGIGNGQRSGGSEFSNNPANG